MRAFGLMTFLGALITASSAVAQTPPATIGEPYVPAPWWMRDPVIASVGAVRTELQANRASFQATFQVVDRNVDDAMRQAADRVRNLSQTLGQFGAESVRVETTIRARPLYEQYRDDAGVIRENARADQIERYEATATVSLQIRDTSVLEQVYAAVLAADPSSVTSISFMLEPSNQTRTELAEEAVRDAARRARAAAEAAGARLGSVRVIDPTGRACQTDVLAGWPSYGSGSIQARDVSITGSRMAVPPPPPPPPPAPPAGRGEDDAVASEAQRLVLQPPFQVLADTACVVYGLG